MNHSIKLKSFQTSYGTNLMTNKELPEEFKDLMLVMDMGAEKHGADTWLNDDNPSLQHKANHASMSRHLSEVYCGKLEDDESGLDPLLHLATRALMAYTRRKRGI